MHIGIISNGTRGDMQPYIPIAKALKALGHEVTMASNEEHAALVESHGVPFRPICVNFRELLDTPDGRAWLEASDSPVAYVRAYRNLFAERAESWLQQIHEGMAGLDAA